MNPPKRKQRPETCYKADAVIDIRGMTALPGFINTHVHCFQSLLKGLGADKPLIGWLNSSVQPFGVRDPAGSCCIFGRYHL